MAPKVLISDKLSPAAVQIFKDRGLEADFLPDIGKDKEKLLEIIGQYDGLAIRSATKRPKRSLRLQTISRLSAAPASVSTMSTYPRPQRAAASS